MGGGLTEPLRHSSGRAVKRAPEQLSGGRDWLLGTHQEAIKTHFCSRRYVVGEPGGVGGGPGLQIQRERVPLITMQLGGVRVGRRGAGLTKRVGMATAKFVSSASSPTQAWAHWSISVSLK